MKLGLLAFLYFVSGAMVFAQDSAYLPSERRAIVVDDAERNPFTKIEEPKPLVVETPLDSEGEESRIELVLSKLAVNGRTRGANGWKVLLGDMILETGKILPPVIAGQTVTLKVAAIYDAMVEIEWVNKDPGGVPKRTFIVIQLNPVVNSALSGQTRATAKEPAVVVAPPKGAPRVITNEKNTGR